MATTIRPRPRPTRRGSAPRPSTQNKPAQKMAENSACEAMPEMLRSTMTWIELATSPVPKLAWAPWYT